MTKMGDRFPFRSAALALALAVSGPLAQAQSTAPALPNLGQDLTPLGTLVSLNPGIADDPNWVATGAVTSVVSPLGDIMLVLTSGFNRIYNNPLVGLPLLAAWTAADSTEHVFVYDITGQTPVLKQVVPVSITIPLPGGERILGKYLQRDRLRSIRPGFLRSWRAGRHCPHLYSERQHRPVERSWKSAD